MAELIEIHPTHPQLRLLRKVVGVLARGGVIVYPTDSCYALGCAIGHKQALDRIRRLRKLDDKHHFTLVCRDLSELSNYAVVDNACYRLLRSYTPGAYTFLLKATREVPRRMQHPNRRTIGLRIPEHTVTQALLEVIEQPLMSTSLILPDSDSPLIEPHAIVDCIGSQVDLIIDGGACHLEPTSVIDLVNGYPEVVRAGAGDISDFIN